MNKSSFAANWKARNFSELQCHAIFLILISPVIYGIIQFREGNSTIFYLLLFFTGFITYTFLEYIAHRFWIHGKKDKRPGKNPGAHMHHHRHPTELKITTAVRNQLLLANVLLIVLAIWLNNYFTLFTGFYTGFVYYCFMHVLLHKSWAKKIFPQLQVSHIHHHCKYPDRCFSTCITWWDKLYNTSVSEEVKISDKVLQFYFGNPVH